MCSPRGARGQGQVISTVSLRLRREGTLRHPAPRQACIDVGIAAEHMLEEPYENNIGPRQALDIVRRYALGQTTDKEFVDVYRTVHNMSKVAYFVRGMESDVGKDFKALRWAAAMSDVWSAVENAARGIVWNTPVSSEVPRRWQARHLKEMLEGSA